MKKKFTLYLLLFLGVNLIGFAQQTNSILKLKLQDIENNSFSFSEIKSNKASVFIFLLTDCPASQNYTLTINKLFQTYSKKNVNFYFVFPDTYSTLDEIIKFKNEYKLKMKVLLDPELTLTKSLEAKVAPQCFVLDNSGNKLYEGRIDDWYYSPGKKRTIIRSNDLDNAIKNYLENKPIDPKKTTPIGCIIN